MHTPTEAVNSDWSTRGLLPAFQPPQHLDVYDIRHASHETQLSVTTMVGLINRSQAKVYLIGSDEDDFWLKAVLASIPHDVSSVSQDGILDELLNKHRDRVKGSIIYDPNFIDSINIATTLAGLRDGIVVSPILAETLQQSSHQLSVLADLRIHHWNNRLEAYLWAQRHLLKDAASSLVAGLDPKIAGALRSFLVATRTFVYWLDPYKVIPDLKNSRITERRLMRQILKAFPPGTLHLGWFVNEAGGVSLTSKAALPVLASDFYFNLEVWTSIQEPSVGAGLAPPWGEVGLTHALGTAGLSEGGFLAHQHASRIEGPQPPPLQDGQTESKKYISFTMSEGDNLQYNQRHMARLWQDPARGSIPIGWTISPVLMQAAPKMAAYYMRTATPNDELVAGPSGAGYMLPSYWPIEQLPAFLRLTGTLMQRMNLSTLEVLDRGLLVSMAFLNKRLQQRFVEALSPFGVRGILGGAGLFRARWRNVAGIPVYQNLGLADSVEKMISLIRNASASSRFLNVYIFAWRMTPSDLKRVVQELGNEYEAVTPGRLLAMIAESETARS